MVQKSRRRRAVTVLGRCAAGAVMADWTQTPGFEEEIGIGSLSHNFDTSKKLKP